MAGATWNCCHLGTSSVYSIQPCHFMQSHIRYMYVYLAVTCHLHFWQNDRDLLRATAVTRGWNGYRNKSKHKKLTLRKKILPSLLQGFKPATFQSRVCRSNHWAIPLLWMSGNFLVRRCMVNMSYFAAAKARQNRRRLLQVKSGGRCVCWVPLLVRKVNCWKLV